MALSFIQCIIMSVISLLLKKYVKEIEQLDQIDGFEENGYLGIGLGVGLV